MYQRGNRGVGSGNSVLVTRLVRGGGHGLCSLWHVPF